MAKLTVTLKQHTPLIHFEHDVEGATLRATELKPKLDKFLTENCFNWKFDVLKEFLIGDAKKYKQNKEDKNKLNPAFDYKVKIKVNEKDKIQNLDISDFKLYFGNMGNGKNKSFSFYKNIEIEFFSFKSKIIDKIEEILPQFLFATNFGTRQSKGFGSFFIDEKDNIYKEKIICIDAFIKKITEKKNKFIYLECSKNLNYRKKFELIDIIYKLMKSGVNYPDKGKVKRGKTYHKSFLFEYFLEKSTGNEKRLIKESFFKYDVRVESDDLEKNYIRGLLGVNESIEFKDKERKGKIIYNSKDVERFKSPLTFKIIDNYIFLIPENSIDLIKGKSFKLYQEKFERNFKEVKVPNEFDISDFIFTYADYINNNLNFDENVTNIFENQIKELKKYPLQKAGDK